MAEVDGGNSATFYTVTGKNARYALEGALIAARAPVANQLALLYQRRKAVDQLVDEVKAWSYWPYRQGWSRQLRVNPSHPRQHAAECLVNVLAEWAAGHPGLAVSGDYAPPACAVEDLLVVLDNRMRAGQAYRSLAHVTKEALGPLGTVVGGVTGAVRSDLYGSESRHPSDPSDILGGLAERLYALFRDLPALPSEERPDVDSTAAHLLRDALAKLELAGQGAG